MRNERRAHARRSIEIGPKSVSTSSAARPGTRPAVARPDGPGRAARREGPAPLSSGMATTEITRRSCAGECVGSSAMRADWARPLSLPEPVADADGGVPQGGEEGRVRERPIERRRGRNGAGGPLVEGDDWSVRIHGRRVAETLERRIRSVDPLRPALSARARTGVDVHRGAGSRGPCLREVEQHDVSGQAKAREPRAPPLPINEA